MRKRFILIALVVVLCFALSYYAILTVADRYELVKYTMYIGLNDKDTYVQIMPFGEAEKKVSDIALKYVDGFTVLSARGAYKDEKGIITNENSLVFQFLYVTDEQIKLIMDEVLKELNQNSILLEKQKVNYTFYEGVKP